jgi:hypothetical protein
MDYIHSIMEKVYSKSGLGKWFNEESAGGKPGWDRYNTKGERIGECGDAKEGESYAACLSKQKAKKLGKEGIAAFVRRKRAAQKKAGRGEKGTSEKKGKKPIFVKTGVTSIKESYNNFITESPSGLFNLEYPPIKANELFPFDVVINESGEIFEVDCVEQLNENYLIQFIDQYGNELKETFTGDTLMGFIDNIEESIHPEFDEKIEIYEDDKKKVKLNKIMRGDVKKYKVYVKNDKGNVVKVNFGDPNMEIKRDDPDRRRNFRARHNCDNPGPRWKARYWACKTWSAKPVSAMLKEEIELLDEAQKNKPKNSKLWSSCISQAKSKFDVYPSAYANAWAAKCYKGKGGKWKKLSESFTNSNIFDSNKSYNPNLWGHLDNYK